MTHPLETITNAIKSVIEGIFGSTSDENTDTASNSFSTFSETVKDVSTAATDAIDNMLEHTENTVNDFLSDPVKFVFGESNENSNPSSDLAEITNMLDEVAGSADSNVVLLNDVLEGQVSMEAKAPVINEEISEVQSASLLEENNNSEINLDSVDSAESNAIPPTKNSSAEEQSGVEDAGIYSNLLQLNEEIYHVAAA